MKKIATLCFFAFALLIGTQSAIAQNKLKINEKAANSAKALKAQLKFDENSLEKVYLAYQKYESKIASLNKTTKPGEQYNKDKNSITIQLHKDIKASLSEDLYNRYLSIAKLDEIEAQEIEAKQKQSHRIKAQ